MTTTIRPTKENLLNFTEEELKGRTFYFYSVLSVRISNGGTNLLSINARRLDINNPPLDKWFLYRIDGIDKKEIDSAKEKDATKKFLEENAEIKESTWYDGLFCIEIKKDAKIEDVRSSMKQFASEDPSVKQKYGAIDITY